MSLTSEIRRALKNADNVKVSDLRDYRFIEIPKAFYPCEMYPGGFCQSYPMINQRLRSKKCLRLWVASLKNEVVAHVKDVSVCFNRMTPKYVIKYKYEDKAFQLSDGTLIPGVVMDWVEGDTLINFVKKNYKNRIVMLRLAKDFYDMVTYLNHNGMSHGDLSGDNIMVTPSRNLVLIDYDSFYIKGQPINIQQPTPGLPAYQHPGRPDNRFLNTYIDFFSQQVIYLSLIAIAEKPSIFNVNIDKGLVFQDADLASRQALEQSPAYKAIASIPNQEVKARLKDLREDIAKPFDKVRSLTAIYEWEAELERRRKEGRPKPMTDIQVPPQKGEEPVREVKTLAPFCGICGYQFPTSRDHAYYCPMCGNKRRTLEQNQLPPWMSEQSPYQGGKK